MIEAESEITLFYVSEIDRTIRYYLLQAASADPPVKPAVYPPGGNWQTLEPEYIASSANSLYFTDLTILTNGDFSYSEVSKSSSYEAAKDAWNKADSIAGDVTSLKEWQAEASSLITKDGIINTVGNYYATTTLVDGVTTRVTEAESIIKQHSDSIEMTVKKDGVISAINQTSESVKISADKISLTAAGLVEIINGGTTKISADKLNLSGYVTISSLSGAGTSTIDGSNIKTGKISTDRLDVNGIFAKDITATGTISGAVLKGASGQFTGTVDAETLYVKGKIQIYASSYSSAVTILEETNGDDINNLILGSYSYGSIISQNHISAPSIYVSGNATIPTLNITDRIEISQATPYIDFHWGNTDTDYTSRIIENARNVLNINGATFTLGGGIWGTSLSVDGTILSNGGNIKCYASGSNEAQVHVQNGLRDAYLCASQSGRSGIYDTKAGWIIFSESDAASTYISGVKIKNSRISIPVKSNTWLSAAQPGNAAVDTICTDANALVPGWRVRSADGAWVGASYAQNPGFIIYYCNASRLAGSTNGTDAMYTFGTSGTFYAKSVSQTSDEREKNIISGITEKYEDLFMQLRPVLFNWKSGADGVHMGFGAQTTLKQAEACGITERELAAVHRSKTEEPWSMNYTEIVPLTVQMTQKALLTIDSTRKEVSALGQNMTARMESLQYQLAQAFDRIAALEKENKSLRQALS